MKEHLCCDRVTGVLGCVWVRPFRPAGIWLHQEAPVFLQLLRGHAPAWSLWGTGAFLGIALSVLLHN